MSDASLSLQRAIYARLKDDAGLQALIGDPARLYDDPPLAATFPYVTLGEARTTPLDGVEGALAHDVRLYAFSAYAGRFEVKSMLGALYDALHDAALVLNGHTLISIRFVFADALRRVDRETYQGVARFRAVTEAA